MRNLINISTRSANAVARLCLAVKYCLRLGYTWHLAWAKAAR